MKALTIHQPWASLLACGVKKYETRGQQGLWNFDIALLASQDTDHLLLAPAT